MMKGVSMSLTGSDWRNPIRRLALRVVVGRYRQRVSELRVETTSVQASATYSSTAHASLIRCSCNSIAGNVPYFRDLRSACLSAEPRFWVFVPSHPLHQDCSLPAPDLRAECQWRPIMATGTVKWFNPTKGFGFIQPEDGSKDVFVHISAVEKSALGSLAEGQRVSFDVVSERGKTAAGNLQAA